MSSGQETGRLILAMMRSWPWPIGKGVFSLRSTRISENWQSYMVNLMQEFFALSFCPQPTKLLPA